MLYFALIKWNLLFCTFLLLCSIRNGIYLTFTFALFYMVPSISTSNKFPRKPFKKHLQIFSGPWYLVSLQSKAHIWVWEKFINIMHYLKCSTFYFLASFVKANASNVTLSKTLALRHAWRYYPLICNLITLF